MDDDLEPDEIRNEVSMNVNSEAILVLDENASKDDVINITGFVTNNEKLRFLGMR